jgi:nucleoside-diphosphate-sugar epimerase
MDSFEREILVTGAGGFIGGRVIEALLQNPDLGIPRPAVRRWSTLARIGRYPIEPVQCDILDPEQVKVAVQGVDAVIHCAVGDRETTVTGTRNLLGAAVDAGVRRFVHVSTIDVYGRAQGSVTEDHPLEMTGRAYGDAKIEAEAVCRDVADSGLEVVILRPTIVYGPFSDLWTIQFAERLRNRAWLLPREACQGTCNLVYVDDLVRAILLAVDAPDAGGKAYNVNGPDRWTWQEYVEAINADLGLPPLSPPPARSARVRSRVVEPVRSAVKEAFHRFQDPVLALYRRSRLARTVMKAVQSQLRRVPSPAEYDLYGRVVDFPSERARQDLGYVPRVSAAEGVQMSGTWLRQEGDLGGAG